LRASVLAEPGAKLGNALHAEQEVATPIRVQGNDVARPQVAEHAHRVGFLPQVSVSRPGKHPFREVFQQRFLEPPDAVEVCVEGAQVNHLILSPGGFPKKVRDAVLKGVKPLTRRPGAMLNPVNFENEKLELRKKYGSRKSGFSITDKYVMSKIMYPQVTLAFLDHKKDFGDTHLLPTPVFLYGIQLEEEVTVELEQGKTLYIKLVSISESDLEGYRTCFFELNGHLREVRTRDRSREIIEQQRVKADPENLHHLASPMPGRVVSIEVHPGDNVKKGDTLFVLEAMKMETSVTSPRNTGVKEIMVKIGDTVKSGDLIIVFH